LSFNSQTAKLKLYIPLIAQVFQESMTPRNPVSILFEITNAHKEKREVLVWPANAN
jgi:hypothetical protein